MQEDIQIHVIDNFSSGRTTNLLQWKWNPNLKIMRGDILSGEQMRDAVEDAQIIWHLAANPEVRVGTRSPEATYRQNVGGTFSLLEVARKARDVNSIIFTSSSAVYGNARVPMSEISTPLLPISVYGGTKLACEALIRGYAETFGIRAIIYRLANVVGPRSRHGVVFDFIQKLRRNPKELKVLGSGSQSKSYVYISDVIAAMRLGCEKCKSSVEVMNIGSVDQISVNSISEVVIEEMGLTNVKIEREQTIKNGAGWRGDVRNMRLDIGRIKAMGWSPKHNSEEAVRLATRKILENPEFLTN
jgi:UDP-glucose 4-epimerase